MLGRRHHGGELDVSNKKELRLEESKIRALTLLFEDKETERKWNYTHKHRLKSMTTRYLFAAALFQGIFIWSDVLESRHSNALGETLFLKSIIRLVLGMVPLLFCFLVATGFVVPTQMSVYISNLLYGIPTLACHFLSRVTNSHWDSLYLIYGLAFFMLPKMSPLNFIYAASGSLILALLYTYFSAFRLGLEEWVLSNFLLGIIYVLMAYISYSSEKASRERFLLKERLHKEKISLKMVASSIQDDFQRAAREERIKSMIRYNELSNMKDQLGNMTKSTLNAMPQLPFMKYKGSPDSDKNGSDGKEVDDAQLTPEEREVKKAQANAELKKNLGLFFKGMLAWGIVVGTAYTFDMISIPLDVQSLEPSKQRGEANTSAAFALLMHTFGFSVFLLYFTGQIRWLIINGVVGLSLMWVFNITGMERKWVVFGTHTVGYVILVIVIITFILVFGGVVLVWTNLIEFLKDILNRYPTIKNELSENKLLEQVLISYVSNLDAEETADGQRHRLQVIKGGDMESTYKHLGSGSSEDLSFDSTPLGDSNYDNTNSNSDMQMREYLPSAHTGGKGKNKKGKKQSRDNSAQDTDDAASLLRQATTDWLTMKEKHDQIVEQKHVGDVIIRQLKERIEDITDAYKRSQKKLGGMEKEREKEKVRDEQVVTQGGEEVEALVEQHNVQMSDMKNRYEKLILAMENQLKVFAQREKEREQSTQSSGDTVITNGTSSAAVSQSRGGNRSRNNSSEFNNQKNLDSRKSAPNLSTSLAKLSPTPTGHTISPSGHLHTTINGNKAQRERDSRDARVHFDKNGVDISARNARRNMNNPNNKNFNPQLRKSDAPVPPGIKANMTMTNRNRGNSFNRIDSNSSVEAVSPLDHSFNSNHSTSNNSLNTTTSNNSNTELDASQLFPVSFLSATALLGINTSLAGSSVEGGSNTSLDSIHKVPSYDPNELELLQSDKELESLLNFAIGEH